MATTFRDLCGHLLDYLGGATEEVNLRNARRAVLAAYREVGHSRNWTYYYKPGYFTTVASYDTGTIQYTQSTRAVTLTGGTWPTWAGSGVVFINWLPYNVASRDSDTQVTLSASVNPGQDIAAGNAYTIYQDAYPLPSDFGRAGTMTNLTGIILASYLNPDDWMAVHRLIRGPGIPTHYTIMASQKTMGIMAFYMYPPPVAVYTFNFIYTRKPRVLAIDLYNTGTATATSAGTTLTGSGTNWTSNMVGSIVRLGSGNTDDDVPTDPAGSSPALVERTITAWTSATSVEMDSAPGQDLTGVRYTISDPIDMEEGPMMTYFLRECERQMRMVKRIKGLDSEELQYGEARTMAWEADSHSFERLGYASQGIRMINFPFDYSQGPY